MKGRSGDTDYYNKRAAKEVEVVDRVKEAHAMIIRVLL